MPTPQQLDDDLDEDEVDPNADPSTLVRDLRKKLRQQGKELRDAQAERSELAQLKQEKVLNSDDLKGLSEKQRAALVKAHDGEFTVDALKQTAAGLGWLADPNAEIDRELDEQERVTTAATTGRTARTTGAITPLTVADWPADKWMRFEKEHPAAAEELLQGKEVHGIAF